MSTSVPDRAQKTQERQTLSAQPIHINNVSAALSTSHIIQNDRIHNTGKPRSHKRTNPRSAREISKVDYTVFYNSGDTTTESSPSPKRSRTVAEVSLREPTKSRINAQHMITRHRLQEMSPNGGRVKLLGTVTSPQPILPKPKIKLENIKHEPVVKTEKQQDVEDYLAKGYCLSAHTDGSACANIQNPSNVNVPPMSIREHQRKQRADKALFLAGLIANQSAKNNCRNAVTDANVQYKSNNIQDKPNQLPCDLNTATKVVPAEKDTEDIQSDSISTTENALPNNAIIMELNDLNSNDNTSRNAVTQVEEVDGNINATKSSLMLKEHIETLDRNGVTTRAVADNQTNSEKNCDLNTTLTVMVLWLQFCFLTVFRAL